MFCPRLITTMLAKEGAIETPLRMRPAEAARSLHRKSFWKSGGFGRHDSNYSLLMTSYSSTEHEIDFKPDSFDPSQRDVSLVQFCVELFSFINV